MAYESDGRLPVVNMRGVRHDGLHWNIVRENFIIRVENHPALCVNDLFVNVLFGGKPGVLVVFYCLQINQSKRKNAEKPDETGAHQHATASAIWIHFAVDGLTTGWIASSSDDRGEIVSRTMFASEIGTIFK